MNFQIILAIFKNFGQNFEPKVNLHVLNCWSAFLDVVTMEM